MSCRGCILVVEDEPDLAEVLRDHIESLGCAVVVARDGVGAFETLGRSVAPCLILSDLGMPNLDGVGLLRRVRDHARHRSLPVVSMSAEPSRERPPGVEAHLDKPFALTDIDPIIARLCRGGPARERVATGRVDP
jgi:CheY-like chemotaxis protein